MRKLAAVFSLAIFAAACSENGADVGDKVRVTPPVGASETATVEKSRLEADVRFLASDLLEGREAGTRGYDIAAEFVAERYRALGLQPGGDDGSYFQQVPMREVRRNLDQAGEMVLEGESAPSAWNEREDYVVSSSVMAEVSTVDAPIVFVGYGIVTEDGSRDDYAGLDVEGKIVAMVSDAPSDLNTEERAHYRSSRNKIASQKGAVGVISLQTPQSEKRFSWDRMLKSYGQGSSMEWLDKDGEAFTDAPNIKVRAFVRLESAPKLFEGAPMSWDVIVAALEDETGTRALQTFELPLSARMTQRSTHTSIKSPNVVGILPGSDPARRDEYIVLTGHLDAIGTRATEEEGDDEIINGAMDNATGIASMLEAARLLAMNPPARSIVFVALTAEEKGLVGSDYFAHNPTVPATGLVANINLDMPILNYEFADIVAFGGERSTMYPIVEAAAERAGLKLSPDPQPEQGFFTRSDQYSFVKMGIPAVYIDLGWGNNGQAPQEEFLKEHYHQPSDEADLVNYDALARFAAVNYEIARGVGDMAERPKWKKDDFFGTLFGGPMEYN